MDRIATASVALVIAGCSLVARIDVCERERPPAFQVNARTEGAQTTSGLQPSAALLTDDAIIVFQSALAADDDGSGPASIRAAIVDSSGRPVEHTCDAPGGEIELVPAEEGARFGEPSIAMPEVTSEPVGLLVFTATRDRRREIHGMWVTETGCPWWRETPTFLISDQTGDSYAPSVAWLGDSTFVVSWTYRGLGPGIVGDVRLRLVRHDGVGRAEFPPTERALRGESISPLPSAALRGVGRVDRVGDGRFAITWKEWISAASQWQLALADRELHVHATRALDSQESQDSVVDSSKRPVAVVNSDRSQLLVVWQTQIEGALRVRGRFLSLDGAPLRTSQSADGEPFFIPGDPSSEAQGRPLLAPVDGGGFLLAIESARAYGGAISAIAFGPDGERRFVNLACGTDAFELASFDDGRNASMVQLAGGNTLLSLTTERRAGDPSGPGISAMGFEPRRLFPLQ